MWTRKEEQLLGNKDYQGIKFCKFREKELCGGERKQQQQQQRSSSSDNEGKH